MPFHKLLPRELQLIKQMIAKYSQCQPCQLICKISTPSCSYLTNHNVEEQCALKISTNLRGNTLFKTMGRLWRGQGL